MMRYYRSLYPAFLSAAMCWMGCTTESNPNFDRAYSEGGESFHARVNGQNWYPIDSWDFVSDFHIGPIQLRRERYPADSGGDIDRIILQIRSSRTHPHSSIAVSLDGPIDRVLEVGTYKLGDSSSGQYATYDQSNRFITTKSHSGVITVSSIDTASHLISGSLWFDAESGDSVLKVRDGDFTVKSR